MDKESLGEKYINEKKKNVVKEFVYERFAGDKSVGKSMGERFMVE